MSRNALKHGECTREAQALLKRCRKALRDEREALREVLRRV